MRGKDQRAENGGVSTGMQGYISMEATKSPPPEVHITVDKFADYEVVVQTLADLQHRGLKKIGFVNNELF
jgi:biopolymer transport protein ExbD